MGLRTVAPAFAVANGALTLATIGALAAGTWLVQQKSEAVEASARQATAARELHLDVLEYQRLSNVLIATGSREVADARSVCLRDIRRRLPDVEPRAARTVAAYLRQRRDLEARQLPLRSVLRRTQRSMDEVVRELRSIEAASAAHRRTARGDARRVVSALETHAIFVALLLAAGWTAFALGLRRHVTQPMLALHSVAERIRGGEPARAEERGSRETAELAQAFNAMTDALARQREDQLAFIAGFVHELKNPLAGVRAAAQAIEDEPERAVRAYALTLMIDEMDRIARLTEDVLDATRIEAGYLELRRTEVDLAILVADALRRRTASSHPIEIDAPEPVRAAVDALRIRQMIDNLVGNAIKYSPEGGRVRVSVGRQGEAAELRISDEGIGLSPSDLAELFSPFRRRASDVAPGTGLGLSVVKRIIHAHGGTIDVASTPGVGSTFCVRLPLGGRC